MVPLGALWGAGIPGQAVRGRRQGLACGGRFGSEIWRRPIMNVTLFRRGELGPECGRRIEVLGKAGFLGDYRARPTTRKGRRSWTPRREVPTNKNLRQYSVNL